MVSPADIRSTPSSANPYLSSLIGDTMYRPGYVITYVLQGNPGDTGTMGGALWAAKNAANLFRIATEAWMAVANISIQPVNIAYDGTGSRSAYTWVETLQDLGEDTLGQHSLPYAGNEGGGDFNNALSIFTTANNQVGGYNLITFLHEIGHGLGLEHPHEQGAAFPGVDDAYDTGDNGLNQGIWTVMSYIDGYDLQMSRSNAYGWSATPMAFDIAAIQLMYGANMSTATGDNVYTLPAVNGSGTYWSCIWDTGGIDTISGVNTNGCVIDLRAATLLNEAGGGGYLSRAYGIVGGFTIANGVTVENATGGAGDDTINGNAAANVLLGNGGSDVIQGFDGNDRIEGGTRSSSLNGGNGDDIVIARSQVGDHLLGEAGNDRLTGGVGADDLQGGSGDDWLIGGGGNDTMRGGDGTDLFWGGARDDTYYVDSASELVFELAGEGRDIIFSTVSLYLYAEIEWLSLVDNAAFGVGNERDNNIAGNNADNLLLGGAGSDILMSGSGSDQLFGEIGADRLYGGADIDYLAGGAGDDQLYGGRGADSLYGEDGDDVLIADGPDDPDSITTFPAEFATDILVGGAGNDVLRGDSGLGDYDLMDGGAGNDSYYVDTYADLTFEAIGGGVDTVYASISSTGYYLYANVENLVLSGNTPFGVGNELDNGITGSAAANWLLGGAGNDTLNGKGGNDVLFGESGTDIFVFDTGSGGDTIADFAVGSDRIDLTAYGFNSFAQVQAATGENGGTAFINLGGGNFIVLNGVAQASLGAGDFILSAAANAPADDLALFVATPVPDALPDLPAMAHALDNPRLVASLDYF